AIGDHPDTNLVNFRSAADADIYKITLQAGQILRLGAMMGEAQFAFRALYNAAGQIQFGTTADSVQLPVDPLELVDLTTDDAWLIKTSGIYYIVVSNLDDFLVPSVVPNLDPGSGDTGRYEFTVEVFDDGDSGFA